eukprot:11947802-Alexandrium_andersonii.AAC.1
MTEADHEIFDFTDAPEEPASDQDQADKQSTSGTSLGGTTLRTGPTPGSSTRASGASSASGRGRPAGSELCCACEASKKVKGSRWCK